MTIGDSRRLSTGTQTILLRDAYEKLCRCGRTLIWEYLNHADITATSECECGMCFTAMFPEIKIEGIDRNHD